MKHIQIAALVIGALLIAGCNKAPSDQGTPGPTAPSGTDRGNSSAPATPNASSPSPSASQEAASKPADDTGRNVRDRSGATLTPGDQSEAKGDLELSRQIRRTINQNDQLSTTAKNVKVVAVNGKVTLRGPVNSDAEKAHIEQVAKGVAGVTAVDDQLEVKGKQ